MIPLKIFVFAFLLVHDVSAYYPSQKKAQTDEDIVREAENNRLSAKAYQAGGYLSGLDEDGNPNLSFENLEKETKCNACRVSVHEIERELQAEMKATTKAGKEKMTQIAATKSLKAACESSIPNYGLQQHGGLAVSFFTKDKAIKKYQDDQVQRILRKRCDELAVEYSGDFLIRMQKPYTLLELQGMLCGPRGLEACSQGRVPPGHQKAILVLFEHSIG
ncbi:hypothetical protein CYMTET_50039 [Cymbomonas tetramitiformis]|uniref:Saposin B-type domain-containing protein n=1 Tax=Cymbomonas tetramitiformis TaxID=36881 RepID=A0AAE0EV57_9CHLO|nr:hypothetical protein CYMTET_50039 [Cymbomonas tetramitiformis]